VRALHDTHPLQDILDRLKAVNNEQLTIRDKYGEASGGFEESKISSVFGEIVMASSDWLEKLDIIEKDLNDFVAGNDKERKAKQELYGFVASMRKDYTKIKSYFSAHPRVFNKE
jgi:hypothetical protein